MSSEVRVGEIVPFGKRKPAQAQKQQAPFKDKVEELLKLVTDTLEQSGIFKKEDIDIEIYLMKIEAHINALEGVVLRANIDLRRRILSKHSPEWLHHLARESKPHQWTAHPAYYLALVEEIRAKKSTAQ